MKKVLIITYYWPPAGGPGVQRWLKFVKYLPEFGIEPIVYIPENPTYPILDQALSKDVSPNVAIIKRKIFEPYALAGLFAKNKVKKMSAGIIPNSHKQSFTEKVALWIRGNIFIPDARVFWAKPSAKFLDKYIRENDIDTIITTGPPHSLHLIGYRLKKKLDLHWVADFRDPWTTIGYQKDLKLSTYSEYRHKKWERRILNAADQIVVTSGTTKHDFSQITKKPIEIITNGFDQEKVASVPLDHKFSLAHIGSLLSERNPAFLWQVLSELVNEVPGFSDHFELKLIGTLSPEVLESIHLYQLDSFVNNPGYLPHDEAIKQQRSSQVLLLIEINSLHTRSIIPGKLFEYMVSGRPILALGPNGSDIAEIIEHTSTGIFIDYGGKDVLKRTILAFYESYLEGNLTVEPVELEQYSRRNLTRKLSELLH
ncbi:glycosyltransferase family 4 protein [Flavobacterium sp. MAH-1]|uniref:Glycosyltransferase family 4 protein n=1 Tax=Flavobacterium agri TaxID=2743471 RepID=A0A7Y9C4H9_9FLAO|nr:glycosyltransferase family 4 protein [Flavobacterium agri]NUY79310.1 glycosyltransferase family 4 protein [Flavobacterium agri]NYA69334.1 glycosyltransferase family 4 protein [Flavobacterium agri]